MTSNVKNILGVRDILFFRQPHHALNLKTSHE